MNINTKGELVIQVKELIESDAVLLECARYAIFQREIFNGLCQILIKDEAKFDDDSGPFWVSVGFGQSYFEDARIMVLKNLCEIEKTQIEKFKSERDTYKKYYEDYLSKNVKLERQVVELKNQVRILQESTNV